MGVGGIPEPRGRTCNVCCLREGTGDVFFEKEEFMVNFVMDRIRVEGRIHAREEMDRNGDKCRKQDGPHNWSIVPIRSTF